MLNLEANSTLSKFEFKARHVRSFEHAGASGLVDFDGGCDHRAGDMFVVCEIDGHARMETQNLIRPYSAVFGGLTRRFVAVSAGGNGVSRPKTAYGVCGAYGGNGDGAYGGNGDGECGGRGDGGTQRQLRKSTKRGGAELLGATEEAFDRLRAGCTAYLLCQHGGRS